MTSGRRGDVRECSDATGAKSSPVLAAEVTWSALQEGDVQDLVTRYHRDVYGYAYRLAGNTADAEDISQQTFLVACRTIRSVRNPWAVRAWLLAIARSCYLRSKRRRRPCAASAAGLDLNSLPADGEADPAWTEREALVTGIAQLSHEHRLVLAMYYFESLTYREIAEQLGVRPGTVMSRLSRAKQRLRTLMEQATAKGVVQ